MFRGIANLSVDAKGRVAVPKIHRDRLEADNITELMATIDPDRCLLIYAMEKWRELELKIMSLPNTDPYNRGLQRTFVGHATELELDGNGRVLIPAALRDYAGIQKKAVMLGQGHKLELWSEEVWTEKSSAYPAMLADTAPESLSEEVRNLSI
ncbi:MAG: division/cell wall cluster transcriptional repressor MraZ [Granulosicoccus sp.]|nr:division/cell wall cluster transcriptional repressor MraZ [Granulosicoccus sp.]